MKNRNIRIYLALAIMVLATFMFAGCSKDSDKNNDTSTNSTAANKSNNNKSDKDKSDDDNNNKKDDELLSGKHHVVIDVKDYGKIEVELDADTAPITVTNFVKLANSKFYDGLTFHRIISGFMIQGGDPLGNGTGGSDEQIKGEFAANNVENGISHVRGTISMARATPFDSASSQFFIMHQDYTSLDGSYAAFGRVTSGMEVVDKIVEDAKPIDNNGTIPADEQPVINSITVVD